MKWQTKKIVEAANYADSYSMWNSLVTTSLLMRTKLDYAFVLHLLFMKPEHWLTVKVMNELIIIEKNAVVRVATAIHAGNGQVLRCLFYCDFFFFVRSHTCSHVCLFDF